MRNRRTDQQRLFGGFVRYQAQVEAAASPQSWTAQAARAVLAAVGGASRNPGPAHLNVALGVPLVGESTPLPPSVTPSPTWPVYTLTPTLPPPTLRRVGKPIFPSAAEVAANPRSRSAVLRVAEKP